MTALRLSLVAMVCAACASPQHLDVGPVPASVSVDARMEFYDINAATLSELRQGMMRQGPSVDGRRWSAVTNWRLQWRWQADGRAIGGCELRHVRVLVTTIVTFPRWQPTAEPDSGMQAWWQQLNAGLVEHERGHATLAVKAAGEIARELEGLRGGSCESLAMRANTIGSNRVREMNDKQREYDQVTRHGGTQIQQAARLREP